MKEFYIAQQEDRGQHSAYCYYYLTENGNSTYKVIRAAQFESLEDCRKFIVEKTGQLSEIQIGYEDRWRPILCTLDQIAYRKKHYD